MTACTKKEYVINNENLKANIIDDNYRTFYEIFVGAFSDSNDDGMGDLQGIIKRLDYLNDGKPDSGKSLGIDAIWLMPIMPSPSYHKYDVTNYMEIDSQYGTIDDFKELIEEADKRGINIIIDLVLNHTSNYHPWFREAKKAVENDDWDNKYVNYYTLIKEEDLGNINGTFYPFAKDYYYEGNFSSQMPELNMDNELVKDEIIEIIKFWFDLGVAGFRLDATQYVYFGNHPKNIEFFGWFMDEVKKVKEDAYVVSEVWAGDAIIAPYYQVMNNFDFGMSQNQGRIASAAGMHDSVNDYVNYLNNYRNLIKSHNETAILNPFISNHDMNRAAGYLSVENYEMHMAANLYLLTYGSPFIYYGEEIGMKGIRGTENTDANRRLAMLWGDKDSVKDPIGSNYELKNQTNGTVKDHLSNEKSLFNHYKKLIMIRNAFPEIARGDYQPINFEGYHSFGGFITTYKNDSSGIFHNTSDNQITIDLSNHTNYDFNSLEVFVGKGEAILVNNLLTIDGKTSVVLK